MKGTAKVILVGGFILASQAAMADGTAFPGAANESGVGIPANVTYASQHANDPVTSVGSAFPGAANESGVGIPANITYASRHANHPMGVAQSGQGRTTSSE